MINWDVLYKKVILDKLKSQKKTLNKKKTKRILTKWLKTVFFSNC